MRLSNAGRSVRDVQAWPSGHLGDSTSRCRIRKLDARMAPSLRRSRDVLVEDRPLPVVHHTSSHDTDGIDTDLFGLSAVARHTRRGACLGQDALKLCTELGFVLAGGGHRAKQRLKPPHVGAAVKARWRGVRPEIAAEDAELIDGVLGSGACWRWHGGHKRDGAAGAEMQAPSLFGERCLVFFPQKKDASLGERGRVVCALSPINPTSVLCRIFSPQHSPKGKSIVCRCPLCLQILSSLFRLSKTSIEPKRHQESQKNTCYRTGNGKALTTMVMRMRSDDGPFLAGQISPLPDSTWGSDWAVRQLSAEIKERLMRLRLPSTKTLPQHSPRARKQLGTGTKHRPMASIRKRFGINSPNRPSRQILPQMPRPGAPAVHEHRLTAAAPHPFVPPGIHGLPRPFQDARTAVLTRRRPVVRSVHARARPWVSHRCSHR